MVCLQSVEWTWAGAILGPNSRSTAPVRRPNLSRSGGAFVGVMQAVQDCPRPDRTSGRTRSWVSLFEEEAPPSASAGSRATTRTPRPANAVVERIIGTLRRECLDHQIILDEQHLRSVLTEFVQYYNHERPHRTLGLQTPELRPRLTTGRIRSRPVLSGLHHVYERAA